MKKSMIVVVVAIIGLSVLGLYFACREKDKKPEAPAETEKPKVAELPPPVQADEVAVSVGDEIGRASCRERV